MSRLAHAVSIAVVLLGCTAVAAEPEHFESYTGEVLIETDGAEMVILVDTNRDGGRDGLVDQWFTLQSADAIVPVSEHLTTARIHHAPGYLRVTSLDRQAVYDFVVAGQERTLNAPNGFTTIRSEGYGLSHNFGKTEIRIAGAARGGRVTTLDIDPEYPDTGGGGGGATACGSGGPGSTSCSASSGNESCSVSCGQGYYACCNSNSYLATCKCYRN
jgi:hypothetical protein